MPGGFVIDGLLETDAVIEPATSGGPLLGADGRVVGITSRLGDDTGYAVPANVARDVLAQLEERHKVIRPWLGIRGRDAPGGVALIDVNAGGPADRAALQTGDVVQSIDGVEVRTLAGLLEEVDRRAVGDTVELLVRAGSPARSRCGWRSGRRRCRRAEGRNFGWVGRRGAGRAISSERLGGPTRIRGKRRDPPRSRLTRFPTQRS